MKDMKTEEVKLRSFEEYLDKKVNAKQRWLLNNFGVRDWCEHANGHCSQQVTAATSELQARIKELEEQVPKWISVEERLPEDGSNVMIMHERYGVMYGYFSETWHSGAIDELSAVTHWMPLPKPLK